MRSLSFVLPFATESLNVRDRKHWAQRRRDKIAMANHVIAAIGGPRYLPDPPFARAKITFNRRGVRKLDDDNLAASFKALLDVLCIRSKTHPMGWGIIEDDSPDHVELVRAQSIAPFGNASTAVWIEELPGVVTTKPKRRTRSALASGV
jgi:hypothetical protein